MFIIEHAQKVAGGPVVAGRDLRWPLEVVDRPAGIEGGPLVNGRQEPVGPVGRPLLRVAPRVGDRHVGGQVLVLGSQGIADPRAGAGKPFEREARAHEHLARPVGIGLRRQRVNEAQVVGAFGQVRQQIGDILAGLAPRLEFPGLCARLPFSPWNVISFSTPGIGWPFRFQSSGL